MRSKINSLSIVLIVVSGLLFGCSPEILLKENFEDDIPGNLPQSQSEPDRAFLNYSGIGTVPEEVGLEILINGALDSTNSLLLNNERPPLEEVLPWNRPYIIFVTTDFDWGEDERIFIAWNGSINSGQNDSFLDIYSPFFNIRLTDGLIYLRTLDQTFSELGTSVENSPHTFLITIDKSSEEYSIEIFQRRTSIIRSGPRPINSTRANPFSGDRITLDMRYDVHVGFDPISSTGNYEIDNILISKEKPEI